LSVPNSYVERLLRDGHLPVRGAGTDAQIPIGDALALKEKRDRERRDGLRELSRLQELPELQTQTPKCVCLNAFSPEPTIK
jgi:hypothetical protein